MSKYYFQIHTADQTYAGTDSNIFVKLYGDKGQSNEIRLNGNINHNAFERNNTDTFSADFDQDCGAIYRIILRSDCKHGGSDWLCDYIKISQQPFDSNQKQVSTFRFKSGEWIKNTEPKTLDATEGYPYNFPLPKRDFIQLSGGIQYLPANTKKEFIVKKEITIAVDYQQVKVLEAGYEVTAKIPIEVIEMNFTEKINVSLTEQLKKTLNSTETFTDTLVIEPSDKARRLQEMWIQENYQYNVTFGSTVYQFQIPNSLRFAGFIDLDNKEKIQKTEKDLAMV
jgi:hypothetical protein